MLTEVHATVAGEEQYARGFDAMASEMRDLKEPLTRVRAIIAHSVSEQFNTRGAHGLGGAWKPLNEQYESWKAIHFPGKSILERTGALHDILVDPFRATLELTARRLVYGVPPSATNEEGESIAEYGGLAQTGGNDDTRPPQRKIFALNLQERRQLDREFVAWINGRRHTLLPG